jgi:hypothetical protein
MPAAYPVNSHQQIIPFDGTPDPSMGMLGQIAVDVSAGAYYQKILGKWYPFGSGPVDPVLTTLTGNPSVDSSPADGTTSNNVTFDAKDQDGNPMQVSLALTTSSTTAELNATTMDTNASTGTATVSLTDTVAEAVTVTATSGSVTGTATSTFT